MGQKDLSEKILFDYEDIFADIINGYFFKGNQVVAPARLKPTGVHSQYKADDRKLHEQERDVAKVWVNENNNIAVKLAVWGLENQTLPEKFMPVRVIGYDGASYRSQLVNPIDAC